MYWVTMTDKFFSGWGLCEGRLSKFVVECDTYHQAFEIQEKAKARSEMRRVNIRSTQPNYPERRYHTKTMHYNEIRWD